MRAFTIHTIAQNIYSDCSEKLVQNVNNNNHNHNENLNSWNFQRKYYDKDMHNVPFDNFISYKL